MRQVPWRRDLAVLVRRILTRVARLVAALLRLGHVSIARAATSGIASALHRFLRAHTLILIARINTWLLLARRASSVNGEALLASRIIPGPSADAATRWRSIGDSAASSDLFAASTAAPLPGGARLD